MSDKSAIEWTDATWNPVRGCTKISPGCAHCYAETFAERFRGVEGHPYERGFDPRLAPEKLDEPLRWRRPRMIFVNSMSDLFHKDVDIAFIAAVFATMREAHWHTYQILTKRADRMQRLLCNPRFPRLVGAQIYHGINEGVFPVRPNESPQIILDEVQRDWPLPNVWLGVSVEDQRRADERIPCLLSTPAAVRFLSVEPLLGPIDLSAFFGGEYATPTASEPNYNFGIDWCIVGGESGAGARPMHPDWARSIRDQCAAAGVPFFFKQWGGARKKAAGRVLDGRTWDEMPRQPSTPANVKT